MSRPHIEFIQSQRLPWEPFVPRPGVTMKRLSEDTGTGALSAILRYPPGWSAPPASLRTDEEFPGSRWCADTWRPEVWPGLLRVLARRPVPAGVRSAGGSDRAYLLLGPRDHFRSGAADRPDRSAGRRLERRSRGDGAGGDGLGAPESAGSGPTRSAARSPTSRRRCHISRRRSQSAIRDPGDLRSIGGRRRAAGHHAGRKLRLAAGEYHRTALMARPRGACFFFRSHGGPQSTEHDPAVPFSFTPPPHRPGSAGRLARCRGHALGSDGALLMASKISLMRLLGS